MSFRIKTEHGIEEKKKASEVLPVLEERRDTVTKVEVHPETSLLFVFMIRKRWESPGTAGNER